MERKWSSLSAICIHLILLCALSVKLESSQTAVSISYLTKFSDQLTSRCKQLVRIRFMVFTRFLACASILPSCLLTWRCEVCRQWCAVWCAKWMKDGGWRSQDDTKMNNRLGEECFDIPGLAQTRQIQSNIYLHPSWMEFTPIDATYQEGINHA